MPGLHHYTHDGDNDVVCAAGDASGDDVSPYGADAAAMADAEAVEDVAANACDALHSADAAALVAEHSKR